MKNILRKLQQTIQEDQDEVKTAIASGGCSSFDEYTRSVGVVQGLELAYLKVEDSIQKLGEDDYDEE